jgi:hypothetical protein
VKYAFLLLLLTGIIVLSALSFEAEELDFYLENDLWEMDGLFHFANYDSLSTRELIYFPVPSDSLCLPAKIKTLAIQDNSGAEVTPLKQTKDGFTFFLSLPALSFCSLHINYTQALKSNYAKYIITTSNSWGRPLPYAKYTLHPGIKVQISSLPFPLQKQEERNYIWEFYDFTPDKEFEVTFQTLSAEEQN